MQVDLLYDPECPNVALARANLLRGFAAAGVQPLWREWRLDDRSAPASARGFGSPTILVDERDVAGAHPTAAADCCRLYAPDEGGSRGAPSVEAIAAALRKSVAADAPKGPRTTGSWRRVVTVIPAIGTALLPKVACPACRPAYAGLLGTLGLGFLLNTTVLLPLTTVFLAIALVPLGYGALRRRCFGPLAVGIVAAAVVLGGKFWLARRTSSCTSASARWWPPRSGMDGPEGRHRSPALSARCTTRLPQVRGELS